MADVSKRTIAILLVVAIILSVTSTLVALARGPEIVKAGTPAGSAEIKVTVAEPPQPDSEVSEIKVKVSEKED